MNAPALKAAVDAARILLQAEPEAGLPRRARVAVWAEMGSGNVGHRLRGRLATRVAERHLTAWERETPGDEPHRMLGAVGEYFRGGLDAPRLARLNDRFLSTLLDGYAGLSESAGSAGYAVWAAVACTLGDEDLEDEMADEERDPETWDSAFWASVAASASTPWRAHGDAEKRGGYWSWYLREVLRVAHDFGVRIPRSVIARSTAS